MKELDLDTAMKKFAEGDRSPEVLAAINKAGSQAFDFPPLPPPDPATASAWTGDRMVVAPLTYERLVHWAEVAQEFTAFLQPAKHRVLIRFNYTLESDRSVLMTLSLQGPTLTTLNVLFESDRRVEPERLNDALRLANTWNREHRWPKATVQQPYLDLAKAEQEYNSQVEELLAASKSASIVLDYDLPFEEGIHQAGLEDALDHLLGASWDFWEMASKEWGL